MVSLLLILVLVFFIFFGFQQRNRISLTGPYGYNYKRNGQNFYCFGMKTWASYRKLSAVSYHNIRKACFGSTLFKSYCRFQILIRDERASNEKASKRYNYSYTRQIQSVNEYQKSQAHPHK